MVLDLQKFESPTECTSPVHPIPVRLPALIKKQFKEAVTTKDKDAECDHITRLVQLISHCFLTSLFLRLYLACGSNSSGSSFGQTSVARILQVVRYYVAVLLWRIACILLSLAAWRWPTDC